MQSKEEVLEHFPECRYFEQSLPKKMTRQKSWSTNLGPGFRKERLVVQVSGGALTRISSVARQPISNSNRENRVDTISRAGHATLLFFFCGVPHHIVPRRRDRPYEPRDIEPCDILALT